MCLLLFYKSEEPRLLSKRIIYIYAAVHYHTYYSYLRRKISANIIALLLTSRGRLGVKINVLSDSVLYPFSNTTKIGHPFQTAQPKLSIGSWYKGYVPLLGIILV